MDLRAPNTGVVNIKSDKCKGAIAYMTVPAPVDALHKTHVVEQSGQRHRFAGLAVYACHFVAHKRDTSRTLEVIDRGGIGINAC